MHFLLCPAVSLPTVRLRHLPTAATRSPPLTPPPAAVGVLPTSFARSVGIGTSCYSGDLWRKHQRNNKKHHPIGWCFLLSLVSKKELSENRGFSFISTFYRYFFLSFMLLIKITRCTTTAANIKIVPQTLIIKGTSVNNSKTFISVQKNQQIEAINHKTLTFFISSPPFRCIIA